MRAVARGAASRFVRATGCARKAAANRASGAAFSLGADSSTLGSECTCACVSYAHAPRLRANWYEGTADAVRRNLHHFDADDDDLLLILSGDQLYRMDLQHVLAHHRSTGASVTIAAKPMMASEVEGLGVLSVDENLRVTRFAEKPTDRGEIESLAVGEQVRHRLRDTQDGPVCLVNMGIYVFDKKTLWSALADPALRDFSKEVLPALVSTRLTTAYLYQGYWRDIGTVRAFFEANLDMTNADPPFDLFAQEFLVFTHPRFLPASRLHRCAIDRAIVADGCRIEDAELTRCVIGVRSRISAGSELRNVVMMGQDRFESERAAQRAREAGLPPIGIGRDCVIREAIIDKNARIGDGVQLSPLGLPDDFEHGDVSVRDGVLVVRKNGVVPSGSVVGGLTRRPEGSIATTPGRAAPHRHPRGAEE